MRPELVRREHGGHRRGAGRRPMYGEPMTQYAVSLPDFLALRLEKLGQGNLSQGVRYVAEQLGDSTPVPSKELDS
jgi:hypothetical protein